MARNDPTAVLKDIFTVCEAIKSRLGEYEPDKVYTIVGAAIFYGPRNSSRQLRGPPLVGPEMPSQAM